MGDPAMVTVDSLGRGCPGMPTISRSVGMSQRRRRLTLSQPSLFIGGADPILQYVATSLDELESHLPDLRQKVVLPGVGHSVAE
jgi:pimeloyl-ACP methyl ester carboxylesterase